MTREDATNRLNEFLRRHYTQMTLTVDDLDIGSEPGVWSFKQPCAKGDLCGMPHPDKLPEPVYHRVVVKDWQSTPATYEEWQVLSASSTT